MASTAPSPWLARFRPRLNRHRSVRLARVLSHLERWPRSPSPQRGPWPLSSHPDGLPCSMRYGYRLLVSRWLELDRGTEREQFRSCSCGVLCCSLRCSYSPPAAAVAPNSTAVLARQVVSTPSLSLAVRGRCNIRRC